MTLAALFHQLRELEAHAARMPEPAFDRELARLTTEILRDPRPTTAGELRDLLAFTSALLEAHDVPPTIRRALDRAAAAVPIIAGNPG